MKFQIGDRIRFVHPNATLGAGTVFAIVDNGKPYVVTLDKTWTRVREGKETTDNVAYADDALIETA